MIVNQEEYVVRVDLALRFIDANLAAELSLERVSKEVYYSPFHFHRVFKQIMGETLNAYIGRRRIERCASVLIRRERASITEIALQYGFANNSSFTRAFKRYYGVNPTEFRRLSPSKFSKISQVKSKNGQVNAVFEKYICNIDSLLKWIDMNAKIEVKVMPALTFASITHIGIDGLEQKFEKLIKWAKPKGLLDDEGKVGRVFYDSFKVTAPEKVRMSVCLFTNQSFEIDKEVSSAQTAKGSYIISSVEIKPHDFGMAWSALFVWMNENGYKKTEGNPFEIYHNNFREHAEGKIKADLYIPIEN